MFDTQPSFPPLAGRHDAVDEYGWYKLTQISVRFPFGYLHLGTPSRHKTSVFLQINNTHNDVCRRFIRLAADTIYAGTY
jgi:hypothetical protein